MSHGHTSRLVSEDLIIEVVVTIDYSLSDGPSVLGKGLIEFRQYQRSPTDEMMEEAHLNLREIEEALRAD